VVTAQQVSHPRDTDASVVLAADGGRRQASVLFWLLTLPRSPIGR